VRVPFFERPLCQLDSCVPSQLGVLFAVIALVFTANASHMRTRSWPLALTDNSRNVLQIVTYESANICDYNCEDAESY
jgi:hypothetical protein